MDRPDTANARPQSSPSNVAFLSLYLLLLAFFILLNTLSQTEKSRMEAALGSIDATFRSEVETKLQSRTATSTPGPVIGLDSLQAELRHLFEAVLPVGQFRIIEKGNLIQIVTRSDLIFVPDRPALRTTRTNLMEGIAAGLTQTGDGARYEVEFQIGTGPALPKTGAAGRSLSVMRAGAFARDLRARGLPKRMIAAGISPGNPDTVRITFFRRGADSRLDFGRVAQ